MRCSKSAVNNAIHKFEHDGQCSDKKWSGHPRKTTSRDDMMKLTVARSPSSCKKIQVMLLQTGCEVSISSISHHLSKEFHLKVSSLLKNQS
jgi:hypothetical protein